MYTRILPSTVDEEPRTSPLVNARFKPMSTNPLNRRTPVTYTAIGGGMMRIASMGRCIFLILLGCTTATVGNEVGPNQRDGPAERSAKRMNEAEPNNAVDGQNPSNNPTITAPINTAQRGPWTTPPPSILPAPKRLVGFADVHGDLAATRTVLKLAQLIDDQDQWIGGETVVVQTGDQLDRGDDERAILDLFERLSEQAWNAGGGFYPLLGNHETMNVALDLRYITAKGFADFADIPYKPSDTAVMAYPREQRGRVAAFRPGGPYATLLAGHNLTMMVGDTVFVHGGILPEHAQVGLETINREVQAWMRGNAPIPDRWIRSRSAPVWSRDYSDDPDSKDCERLTEALRILGARRMVVGHTVQSGANPACDGKVWKMDVGMAAHYGGRPAAIEIVGDTASVLQ